MRAGEIRLFNCGPFMDGEPCGHPGCLSHVTHPCEGCGRVAGRARRYELMSEFYDRMQKKFIGAYNTRETRDAIEAEVSVFVKRLLEAGVEEAFTADLKSFLTLRITLGGYQ